MPTQPLRRYATPASEFGIAKPVESWFDFAASGTPRTGPAFSTALSEAENRNTQRELERLQLQRQLQSEQAAQEFLANAAGQKPKGLMRMLSESPEILTSDSAPAIQQYVASRQQQQAERKAAKQPFSNQILGPAIAKSLDPEDQVAFSRRLEAGESATDAFDAIQTERQKRLQSTRVREAAMEAARNRVPLAQIQEAMQSPDPELALAALQGSIGDASSRGGASVSDALAIMKSATDDVGDIIDPVRYQLGQDLLNAATQRSLPQAAPQAVGPTFMEPATTPVTAPATAPVVAPAATPPTLAPIPLSPFEQQQATAVSPTQVATQARNEAWTAVKAQPLTAATADMGVAPERIVSLSQKALLGQPLEGASQNEQELANLIGQFALRAAEDKPIQVGTEAGEGGVVPVLEQPGYALLKRLGVDPNERITIPGGGALGMDKTMRAWELMNLRLKEIAQPLQQAQKAAQTLTPEVQSAYERAKARAQGLTPAQE